MPILINSCITRNLMHPRKTHQPIAPHATHQHKFPIIKKSNRRDNNRQNKTKETDLRPLRTFSKNYSKFKDIALIIKTLQAVKIKKRGKTMR